MLGEVSTKLDKLCEVIKAGSQNLKTFKDLNKLGQENVEFWVIEVPYAAARTWSASGQSRSCRCSARAGRRRAAGDQSSDWRGPNGRVRGGVPTAGSGESGRRRKGPRGAPFPGRLSLQIGGLSPLEKHGR